MDICLVRHAIAVERGTPGYEDDRKRDLTREGRARMEEVAAGLARVFTPQAILTSPLVRAVQTADVLREVYGLGKPLACDALATGDHEGVLRVLDDLDAESIALVGHEPWMSELLSYLLTGEPGTVAVTMKKGGAALVGSRGAPRPGACWLEWLAPPGMLRRVGRGRD